MRILALLLLGLAAPAWASDAAAILEEARAANQVDSSIQKVRMVIVGRNGAERVRELELRGRRDGDVVKSHVRFTSPSDVAGTQLLTVDHPDQADEQLLYMPAIKRVNRISGKARRGSFMGSDFAYEDLEMGGAAGARHTLVEESDETWVIDTTPAGDSQYGRVRAHVSKADKVARAVEFFDKDDAPLKKLEVVKTERSGTVTLPVESVMRNLQKGTQTRMIILEHRLDVPADELPDEVFTPAYLERSG